MSKLGLRAYIGTLDKVLDVASVSHYENGDAIVVLVREKGFVDAFDINDDNHLMRATGLFDKNGHEIYEGHLVEIDVFTGKLGQSVKQLGFIKYNKRDAGFKWFSVEPHEKADGANYWLSSADKSQREVVGVVFNQSRAVRCE